MGVTTEITKADAAEWRTGVTVVRAEAQRAAKQETAGAGRTTVVDHAGTGGERTWIGTVTLLPGTRTGTHHHGRHEVTIYIVKGSLEIRWGKRLEYVADLTPGDFAYFAPFVPHQEFNRQATETVDLIAIRSDNERIAIPLADNSVERPETVY